jgi:hypothetical protein
MPELVGKLAPVAGADVYDDPAGRGIISVEPDGRRSIGMIVDAEFFRLMIGNQGHARQAGCAHALDHGGRIPRLRATPGPSKLQRGGEQRHAGRDGMGHSGFQWQQGTSPKQEQ